MSLLLCLALSVGLAAGESPTGFTIETTHLTWTVGADAVTQVFADKATGTNYAAPNDAKTPFARIQKDGTWFPASAVLKTDNRISLSFGESGVTATLKLTKKTDYFIVEIAAMEGGGVTEFVFLDIPLTLTGTLADSYAASILALNLQTNSPLIPGPNNRLTAHAYSRFGFEGAKAAIVACPGPALRDLMKTVVKTAQPEIPPSDIGGPWALDGEINRGSYLFDFGALTEETVDDWIKTVKALGMNQIDFHTGSSLRFGDCEPNPELFPKGRESVKAVIDKLHAAGISAGLHTYAFFIAKETPYVTPVPDPRLGKFQSFTLADDLSAEATAVPVVETTEKMSTTTGFFVWNSVTLQIDDELIIFKQVKKDAPYAFTECERGAHGTKISAHKKGAQVHHLRECFGLFTPDADSTLLAEIAANTANTFNECGFDMIYLDALDGEGVLAGPEWGWHYGSKFTFEIAKRLKRPALFEMSTFHHHLWYVRARMGAWDCSLRAHMRNIDVHLAANQEGAGMFLPMNLGWWTVKTWEDGPWVTQIDPTFPEDVEYLMGKCLGAGMGFSLMGVNPKSYAKTPAFQRLAPIFEAYENLRHSNTVPESIKAQLRTPRQSFVMTKNQSGAAQFAPADYPKQKISGADERSATWTVNNRYGNQPLRVRLEALLMLEPFDAATSIVAEDFQSPGLVAGAAEGVTASHEVLATMEGAPNGAGPGIRYRATNTRDTANGAWSMLDRVFEAPKDWSKNMGLGVWVKGDGSGALLNVQLRSPEHTIYRGSGDHYITLDFTGWRYFELAEPDSDKIDDYKWPYGGTYATYREFVDYTQVSSLTLWFNNLPVGKEMTCEIGSIHALPLVAGKVSQPSLKIGDSTVAFPVDLESGQYLECDATGKAVLYSKLGERVQDVTPTGTWPTLAPGANTLTFAATSTGAQKPRVRATVATQGDAIRP